MKRALLFAALAATLGGASTQGQAPPAKKPWLSVRSLILEPPLEGTFHMLRIDLGPIEKNAAEGHVFLHPNPFRYDRVGWPILDAPGPFLPATKTKVQFSFTAAQQGGVRVGSISGDNLNKEIPGLKGRLQLVTDGRGGQTHRALYYDHKTKARVVPLESSPLPPGLNPFVDVE